MHQELESNVVSRATRIAIIVESLTGGGVQHRTRSLAKAFAGAGYSVDIYVSKYAAASKELAGPTIDVHKLDGANRKSLTKSLTRQLRPRPPALLFSTGTTLHPVAVAAKRMMPHIPLVLRADSYPFRNIPWSNIKPRLLEPYRRRQRKSWFQSADLVIAVSHSVENAVRGLAPSTPIATLPSPVIDDDFRAALALGPPDHPWARDSIPLAVAVGRIALAKDYPTMFRALASVTITRPLRLIILGDGKERDRRHLQQLARALGVEDRVGFVGWTNEVARWLAAASVFVSTSIWEGSPGAIIEALAAGVPIVATDCPGDTRKLLHDGKLGHLVRIGDVCVIANAIKAALDTPVDTDAERLAADPFGEAGACAGYVEMIGSFLSSRNELPCASVRS